MADSTDKLYGCREMDVPRPLVLLIAQVVLLTIACAAPSPTATSTTSPSTSPTGQVASVPVGTVRPTVAEAARPTQPPEQPTPRPKSGEQANIVVQDDLFEPTEVTVRVNETVVWRQEGVREHNVTAVDGTWGSGPLLLGSVYTMKFSRPGTYLFYCTIHTGMRGAVLVVE